MIPFDLNSINNSALIGLCILLSVIAIIGAVLVALDSMRSGKAIERGLAIRSGETYLLNRRVSHLAESAESKEASDRLRSRVQDLESWTDQHRIQLQAILIGLNSIGLKLGESNGQQAAEFPELAEIIEQAKQQGEVAKDTHIDEAKKLQHDGSVIPVEPGNEKQLNAAFNMAEGLGYRSDEPWNTDRRPYRDTTHVLLWKGKYEMHTHPCDIAKGVKREIFPLVMPKEEPAQEDPKEEIQAGDWAKVLPIAGDELPDHWCASMRDTLECVYLVRHIDVDGYAYLANKHFYLSKELRRIGPNLPTGREVLVGALLSTKESVGLHLPRKGNLMKPIIPGGKLIDVLRRFRWDKQKSRKTNFERYAKLIEVLPEEQQIVDYWV